MKIKKFILVSVLLIAVVSIFTLTACSNIIAIDKFLGFTAEDVNKIIIINEDNVEKDLTYKKDEIFKALEGAELKKSAETKYEHSWNIDYGYKINFYVNGIDGYYCLTLNHGAQAMDGFDNKNSRTGFYDFSNKETLKSAFDDIFYL